MIEEKDAVQTFAEAAGRSARSCRAHRIGGTDLWSIGLLDDQGRPEPGTFTVVGPDRRIWGFSSNPMIHDPSLVGSVLHALYRAGLTSLVEDDPLQERFRELTAQRIAQTRNVVQAAEAGELRSRPPRLLP